MPGWGRSQAAHGGRTARKDEVVSTKDKARGKSGNDEGGIVSVWVTEAVTGIVTKAVMVSVTGTVTESVSECRLPLKTDPFVPLKSDPPP